SVSRILESGDWRSTWTGSGCGQLWKRSGNLLEWELGDKLPLRPGEINRADVGGDGALPWKRSPTALHLGGAQRCVRRLAPCDKRRFSAVGFGQCGIQR